MKAVIVDDEVNGRSTLRHMLSICAHDVEVVGEAGNVAEAINVINHRKPDVVFLDIEMPGGSGFTLFDTFPKPNFHVIFATAYDKFAFKAFKLAALDYLMKPIDPDDLKAALAKVREADSKSKLEERINTLLETLGQFHQKLPLEGTTASAPTPANPVSLLYPGDMERKMVLAGQFSSDIVQIKDIIYFEGDGQYTKVFMKGQREVVNSRSLKQFEDLLEDYPFFRIHKSFLINLHEVTQILRAFPFEVVMTNDVKLEVSRRKKDELMEVLEKLLAQ